MWTGLMERWKYWTKPYSSIKLHHSEMDRGGPWWRLLKGAKEVKIHKTLDIKKGVLFFFFLPLASKVLQKAPRT